MDTHVSRIGLGVFFLPSGLFPLLPTLTDQSTGLFMLAGRSLLYDGDNRRRR